MTDPIQRAQERMARGHWFEAERLLDRALSDAWRSDDLEQMLRILDPLAETRRQRILPALQSRRIEIVQEPLTEQMAIEVGCYLVQPPQVGADARRLRLLALRREIPAAVLCREPRTRRDECPIVAIGGGATVRTKVEPPAEWDHPDHEWFVGALERLGEAAIESVDPGLDIHRRIEAVLGRLDAVPDHRGLHEFLAETCREALEAVGADDRSTAAEQ
jgi:hypothetical protein